MNTPQSLMEVTGALSDRAREVRFTFGDDTVLVAVQHMLTQTVDLFRALGQVGLKPSNIFALGKIYSNNATVISAIRDLGVTVLENTVPDPGRFDESFKHDIKRLWNAVAQNLELRRIKRIIVLDEGGNCVTHTPPELLRKYLFAGVEQTSRGIFIFEETPPPFAVFSWARAAVKLEIGGHLFSHCLIDRLRNDFLGGRSLRGLEIGIAGLGSIGRGLANIALREGSRVFFYDPASHCSIPRYLQDGLTRVDSLQELMLRCDYLLGASGRNPFEGSWPLAHRPGIKLISASGGDHEFGPIIRDLARSASFKVAADTWDISSEDGPSGSIHIAFMGFPYNFVSRAEAAVPTRVVQLETSGLLAGLMQARTYLRLIEEGHERSAGIHRISPEAQRFVFETWLSAMEDHGIDVRRIYGYDPALLEATKRANWFADHSDPGSRQGFGSISWLEGLMSRMVDQHLQVAR
jgi:hypothetical protein